MLTLISTRHLDEAMPQACRACGERKFEEVLDLGLMPLAGDFRRQGEANKLYPLAVDVCEGCGLLQIREDVPPSVIFSPQYSYASSTIPALVRHFDEYARQVAPEPGTSRKRLLEIGCNDGVFLKPLADAGYEVVGIDASENVAEMARERNLDVRSGLFGKRMAEEQKDALGAFDVISCSNVFAHNSAVSDFVEGVLLLLRPGGEFWIEVHSAQSLYEGLQWDCFYHEHCFYWTVHSLSRCLAAHGLNLIRYTTTPMHGGSLRAVFSRGEGSVVPSETELTLENWRRFRTRSLRSRVIIRDTIESLPIRYAYGAAGRAVILINWTGIAPRLRFVVDGSPLRHGRTIPNTTVPVISEDEFSMRPDVDGWCLVTAHNYLEDIRRKVDSNHPERLVRFVTPLPHVAIQ